MQIYFLKPHRLVVEAENETDRLKLNLLEPEFRKLVREFDDRFTKQQRTEISDAN